MTPPPPCVTPNQRLLDALPSLRASEQRNIPVVNTRTEKGLVGALARAEVWSLFSEEMAGVRILPTQVRALSPGTGARNLFRFGALGSMGVEAE
jgi:hypothetical protein